jgi:hypothetical protein
MESLLKWLSVEAQKADDEAHKIDEGDDLSRSMAWARASAYYEVMDKIRSL